jgi:F0F1-type ATP synthase delta subunit
MNSSKLSANDIVDGIYSYLKKNGSENLLPEIIKILGSYKEVKPEVSILTAVQLNEVNKKKAESLAKRLIKETNLIFNFQQDVSIIDGLKINYKDKVWDLTLKSQLTKLLNQIAK